MTDYMLVQKVRCHYLKIARSVCQSSFWYFQIAFLIELFLTPNPFWNPFFEILSLYWKQSGFSYNVCIYYIFHISCIFLHFWHKSKLSEMKELIFNHVYPNVVWTHGVLFYWMWTSLLWVTYTVLTLPPCPLTGSSVHSLRIWDIFIALWHFYTFLSVS